MPGTRFTPGPAKPGPGAGHDKSGWNNVDAARDSAMMRTEKFPIASIYVPKERRSTLDPKKVDEIVASMLEKGQQTPILVRPDGERFVLVEGLHRLEACKKLGDVTIVGYRVQARRH
jgi:uncharacterized ParB-like nuclease family protein